MLLACETELRTFAHRDNLVKKLLPGLLTFVCTLGVQSMDAETLKKELTEIATEASKFFKTVGNRTWDELTPKQRKMSDDTATRLTRFSSQFQQAVQLSPLLQSEDQHLRTVLRVMWGYLRQKNLSYQPETGTYQEFALIMPANGLFTSSVEHLLERIPLIAPPETQGQVLAPTPALQGFLRNTAFIMMQISEALAELEDLNIAIKEVFAEFGVSARRADEIEHSDVITDTILREISMSEFLFADLSGARPSVYYEVGYAHALGKHPILYRKKGSELHFDLLVHNVPEYKNATDLKNQLRKRLEAITGRKSTVQSGVIA
jgi:hypothetical protein